MIIIMSHGATESEIQAVCRKIEDFGLKARRISGEERAIIGVVGREKLPPHELFLGLPGVSDVKRVTKPYKVVAREFKSGDTHVQVGDVTIGGSDVVIVAGPCSVESRAQILEIAHAVKEAGAHLLRGGAYKPRTSPYSFQGMGEEALKYLAEARQATGLPVVTEVMDAAQLPALVEHADMIQVGCRNMQNYALLKKIGQQKKPILLKRGYAATIEEMLTSAEYIASEGNEQIVLCERGIRTFERETRNTLDLNAVPAVKRLSHLPIVVDPSHGTGVRKYVPDLARAAVACGAHGILLEVHTDPDKSFSDAAQTLSVEVFRKLVPDLRAIARVVGKDLAREPQPAR